jgi:hypothetical protein
VTHSRREFLRQFAAAAAGASVSFAPVRLTAIVQTARSRSPELTAERPFQVGNQLFPSNQFQQAVGALADGGVLMVRGGASYHVTGSLRRNGVTIRAVGGKATFDGKRDSAFPAQGKAIIVQQGNSATFEDLVFRNVAVPDANGAGVRVEGTGMTTFHRCEFRDSEQGILTQRFQYSPDPWEIASETTWAPVRDSHMACTAALPAHSQSKAERGATPTRSPAEVARRPDPRMCD